MALWQRVGGSHDACGLACVWREFQSELAAGKPWNSDTFIAVAARRTEERTASFVRTVTNTVDAQPDALLRKGLTQAGWTVAPPLAAARGAAPRRGISSLD